MSPLTIPRIAPPQATARIAVLGNESLAHELKLPLAANAGADYDFVLAWTGTLLELRDCRDDKLNPLHIDFSNADLRRYSAGLSRRQPLARAIGKAQLVADATAGLA